MFAPYRLTVSPEGSRNGLAHPLLEILGVVTCVLLAEWAVLPLFGKNYWVGIVPVAVAFIVMFVSHLKRGETIRDLGWRFDNLDQCLLLLLLPMIISTLVLAAIGWYLGSLRLTSVSPAWDIVWVFLGLFAWGLMQQYPLQGFINRRSQIVFGKGATTTFLVAALFALLHMPNLWLSVATFFGGVLWAWTYQRIPNLFALALSHAIMTIVLVLTVPYSSLYGLRVGYGYFLR